jgi:hypothetical protein
MNDNWKMVFSSNSAFEIEILTAVLKENQIESVAINKKDSMYLIGSIELFVDQSQAERALELINENNK